MNNMGYISLLVALLGLVGCSRNSPPSISEVRAPVEAFLIAELKASCQGGSASLDELSIQRVGAYARELGGWPVYAAYITTCVKGNVTYTYDGKKYPDSAAAFVRRSGGRVEAYTPEVFRQLSRELQKKFDSIGR